MTVSETELASDTFRRLLLQIGGANIAGADRACQPPTSSSFVGEVEVTRARGRERLATQGGKEFSHRIALIDQLSNLLPSASQWV
jgi:hypothetical protein